MTRSDTETTDKELYSYRSGLLLSLRSLVASFHAKVRSFPFPLLEGWESASDKKKGVRTRGTSHDDLDLISETHPLPIVIPSKDSKIFSGVVLPV